METKHTQQEKLNEKIAELTLKLPKSRATSKQEIVKDISLSFLELRKSQNNIAFPREHLNSLFENVKISHRAKQRNVKELIAYMTTNKMIKENVVIKPIYTFRNKPLSSYDYGSYNLLMAKNGYKRVLYKYKQSKEGYPIKKRVAVFSLNEKIPAELIYPDDYDTTEIKSSKDKTQQGIYSNSQKSVIKDFCHYSEKKVYTII